MGRVLPKGSVIPRVGHEVTVLVGEPIDLSDITCRCNRDGIDQQQVGVLRLLSEPDVSAYMHPASAADCFVAFSLSLLDCWRHA